MDAQLSCSRPQSLGCDSMRVAAFRLGSGSRQRTCLHRIETVEKEYHPKASPSGLPFPHFPV